VTSPRMSQWPAHDGSPEAHALRDASSPPESVASSASGNAAGVQGTGATSVAQFASADDALAYIEGEYPRCRSCPGYVERALTCPECPGPLPVDAFALVRDALAKGADAERRLESARRLIADETRIHPWTPPGGSRP
jgi:hypothetical protein